MQPCSREMQALLNQTQQQISLQDTHSFDPSINQDDFLEQILNTIPSSSSATTTSTWSHHDLIKSPWEQHLNAQSADFSDETHDQSVFLASKFRQHQISGGGSGGQAAAAAAKLLLQQQMLMAMNGETENGFPGSFKSPNQALFNGLAGSLHGAGQTLNQPQHFHQNQAGNLQAQYFNSPAGGSTMNNIQSQASGSTGGAPQQPRQQRVRARRGQATDPHSIAERLRRERIAERMKALQELVPNANKTDKASMLDEIIDYVKFLQLQVKVLSMSRLGGAAAVAPLVADVSSEGGGDCAAKTSSIRSTNGNNVTASSSSNNETNNSNTLTMTEHQVAKLMEQDMGQAMQYLQGKGLCLMPISLATAISTATCRTTPTILNNNPFIQCAAENSTSPTMSALTVQSATIANGGTNADGPVKETASVSKS